MALLALGAAPLTLTADFTTTPVGFNKVVCLTGTDTTVSVPFVRQGGSLEGKVSSKANPALNRVQITVAGNASWTGDQYKDTHYVRFISGNRAGQWYDVVNNGADTLMLDTNGDDLLNNVAADDRFLLAAHWTLDSLFPPDDQGAGDGSVIRRSPDHNKVNRRTEVELPSYGEGANLPAGPIFYLTANGWHQETDGTPMAGGTIIPPSSSFIIRHLGGAQTSTFVPSGMVLTGPEMLVLSTSSSESQDNDVAITRPVPVTLNEAGLESAFVESVGHRPFQIRDKVFVFDNTQNSGQVASATYYRMDGDWYRNDGLGASN
ncbi:MAG: TIGR02597 family protein, partial [Chthoniobacterales bacterium]